MKKLCSQCFKQRCKHQVEKFECDDLLVDAIRRLNKLGYKTMFSCSGHPYNEIKNDVVVENNQFNLQTYIVFEEIYDVPFLSAKIDFKLSDFEVKNKTFRRLVIENIKKIDTDDIKAQKEYIKYNVNAIYTWLDLVEKYHGN